MDVGNTVVGIAVPKIESWRCGRKFLAGDGQDESVSLHGVVVMVVMTMLYLYCFS